MASLSLKQINKTYSKNITAVKDLNLEIEDKEFIVLLGNNGSGKSTTLKMIAGLEPVSNGEIFIDDRILNDVSPIDRKTAIVSKNYGLNIRKTVYDNIALGLEKKDISKEEIDKKVKKVANILNIDHLLERKLKALSDGQRQRVALGRATIIEPKVFLVDEPLESLGDKLKIQMRIETLKLYKNLQTTFIYATNDQMEAMKIGTRIAVMEDGTIQQVDLPQNIYDKPESLFVAKFIGKPQMNFINTKVVQKKKSAILVIGEDSVTLQEDKSAILIEKDYIGKEVVMGIRPEDIDYNERFIESHMYSSFQSQVEAIEINESETLLHVLKDKNEIIVGAKDALKVKTGDKLKIALDENKIHIFDKETEVSLF